MYKRQDQGLSENVESENTEGEERMKATVLIDNLTKDALKKEWGLAIYIEYGERRILLDTGCLLYTSFLKDKLHQQHVENRASCDGKQHLTFPNVKRHYSGDADGLRDTVTAGKNRHIFETVDDQQSEDVYKRQHQRDFPSR